MKLFHPWLLHWYLPLKSFILFSYFCCLDLLIDDKISLWDLQCNYELRMLCNTFIIQNKKASLSSFQEYICLNLSKRFNCVFWEIPGFFNGKVPLLQFRETLSLFQGKICGYFRDVSDLIEKMIPFFGISTCFNTWSLLTIQMASFLVKERFKFQNLDGEKWTNFI